MATGNKSFVQTGSPMVAGLASSVSTLERRFASIPLQDNPECSSDVYSSLPHTSNDQSADEVQMKYQTLEIFHTPVCMIDTDSDGNLRINGDCLDQIAQIDSELSIVAMTGPYRSGKSYLLNRLAGATKGFKVGSTTKPVTKGIWVWCRPHLKRKGQVLLLLDTEGLDDVQKDNGEFDNQLLVLAILLCSTFIYNCKGVPGRSLLENLQFVAELSKHIKLSDEKSDKDSGDLDLYFPFFILILRDFDLEIEESGNDDTYFENVILGLKQNCDTEGQKKNDIRSSIRNYFKRRKCFTLSVPGGTTITRNMQDLEDDKIDGHFISKYKLFAEFVYDKCPTKEIKHGRAIDGEKFAILTRKYVEEIWSGKVPKIKTVLYMVTQEMNSRAVQRCVDLYQFRMVKMLQLPTSSNATLLEIHQTCSKDALSLFLDISIYEEEGESLKLANDRISAAYKIFELQDENASIAKSEAVLKELGTDIAEKMKMRSYFRTGGYDLYRRDIKELEKKYNECSGLGWKKEQTWSKYLSDKAAEEDQILMIDSELTEKEKEIEAARRNADEAMRQQQYLQQSLIQQEHIYEAERERSENSHLMQEIQHKEEIERKEKHFQEILCKRLEEQERLLQEGFDKTAKSLTSQIKDLSQRMKEMQEMKEKLDRISKMGAFKLLGMGIKRFFKSKNDIE